MLNQRFRVAIRRHLGVPFANSAQAGRLFGWRFAIHVEDLEYKMSNMSPNEEQLITGNAVGGWQIYPPNAIGDVLTFTVTDAGGVHTTTYTVTAADVSPPPNIVNPVEASTTFSIALNAAKQINSAFGPLGYSSAASMPSDTQSAPYFQPPFSEVIITGPSSSIFTIGSLSPGMTNLIVGLPVAPCPVAATINSVPLFGYVPIIDALQNRISFADLSLWIQKADVVNFRPDEVRARVQQYRTHCELLSRDLGGKEYVDQFFSGGGHGAIA